MEKGRPAWGMWVAWSRHLRKVKEWGAAKGKSGGRRGRKLLDGGEGFKYRAAVNDGGSMRARDEWGCGEGEARSGLVISKPNSIKPATNKLLEIRSVPTVLQSLISGSFYTLKSYQPKSIVYVGYRYQQSSYKSKVAHVKYIFLNSFKSSNKLIHANTDNIFLWKIYFPNRVSQRLLLSMFARLFRSYLIEDAGFSHLLWHSVLPYVVLTEEYWINPGFTHICSWKGGELISISFSDNWGHSSLTQPHNSTNGSFLKVICDVESETLSTRFLYPLTFRCNWAHLHLEWVFLPSVTCNIMCWSFGKCWPPELFRSSKCSIENPLYKSVCRAYLY